MYQRVRDSFLHLFLVPSVCTAPRGCSDMEPRDHLGTQYGLHMRLIHFCGDHWFQLSFNPHNTLLALYSDIPLLLSPCLVQWMMFGIVPTHRIILYQEHFASRPFFHTHLQHRRLGPASYIHILTNTRNRQMSHWDSTIRKGPNCSKMMNQSLIYWSCVRVVR